MKVEQSLWSAGIGWQPSLTRSELGEAAQVVLVFGGLVPVRESGCLQEIRKTYPHAHVLGCTTAGEIHGPRTTDETVAVTAIAFEHGRVATAAARIEGAAGSLEAGARLISGLDPEGLRHVLVMSEGIQVDACELVKGVNSVLPAGVTVSGGCAGDDHRRQETHVWCDGEPVQSGAVALGFYGERLQVGVGAMAGWKPFGPDRLITRSHQDVLYELDYRPALPLFKKYLGDQVDGLPGNGLEFPLELCFGRDPKGVLRAVLGIDQAEQSIICGGTMPEGAYARFMVGTVDALIAASAEAARVSVAALRPFKPQLSVLMSCRGRRWVLRERVEEEVVAVAEVLGTGTAMTGFYSYGEIAPIVLGGPTQLHNETMTVTCFAET